MSRARCRMSAYGPAGAIAIPKPHFLLCHLNPDWFYLSGASFTHVVPEKRPLNAYSSSSSSSSSILWLNDFFSLSYELSNV